MDLLIIHFCLLAITHNSFGLQHTRLVVGFHIADGHTMLDHISFMFATTVLRKYILSFLWKYLLHYSSVVILFNNTEVQFFCKIFILYYFLCSVFFLFFFVFSNQLSSTWKLVWSSTMSYSGIRLYSTTKVTKSI